MFLKLKFLEGWSLESRRQKNNKIYVLFVFNIYFFEGLATGKPAAKKNLNKI